VEISEAIASHRELDQPFRDLAPLHRVVRIVFSGGSPVEREPYSFPHANLRR
jgi:hypothetical protein